MLFVCCPLLDEEGTVRAFHRNILDHSPPDVRVVFTLDAKSSSLLREECLDISRGHSGTYYNLDLSCGTVVDAYLSGFRYAAQSGAAEILEIDGGGGHEPSDIPKFLQHKEHDLVAGSRFLPGSSFSGATSRRITSRLGGALGGALLGPRMTDMTSGFHLYRGRAIERMLKHDFVSNGHFYQTEVRSLLGDLPWKEVPISYRAQGGLPKGAIFQSLKDLSKAWKAKQWQKK